MKKKVMAAALASALCIAIGIGGTLAWLTAETPDVVNTFTTSDINITLEETKGGEKKEFKMVPGYTIQKDPKATVVAGSEECYLFVKLEKSDNFDSFLTYEMAEGWTELTGVSGVSGVYYRVIDSAEKMGVPYSVLKNDQVSVKDTVTKEMMNGLTAQTYPTLTVTAYASQLYKSNVGTDAERTFTATEAWTVLNPTT